MLVKELNECCPKRRCCISLKMHPTCVESTWTLPTLPTSRVVITYVSLHSEALRLCYKTSDLIAERIKCAESVSAEPERCRCTLIGVNTLRLLYTKERVTKHVEKNGREENKHCKGVIIIFNCCGGDVELIADRLCVPACFMTQRSVSPGTKFGFEPYLQMFMKYTNGSL